MYYYDVSRTGTTNASAGTEDKLLGVRTAANQRTLAIMGVYVSGRHNTSGGVIIRLKTADTTANTGGSAVAKSKRDPDAPAASATVVDSTMTAGSTLVVRQIVGAAAQGGFGGWFAATPEQSLILKANGGATGNAELYMVGGAASLNFENQLEFAEI